jgi:hypothetical protein
VQEHEHSASVAVTELPRTPLTTEAHEAMERVLPPALFRHSVRTFLYGRAWARHHAVSFDEEGLLLVSLFHDAGLCAPYKDTRRAFQFNSGRALAQTLSGLGVDRRRINRLVDAVLHHFQPVPRWSYGPEAGLLHVGAYMDATGLRAWSVAREERRAIRCRYPRRVSTMRLLSLIARSIRGPQSCIGIMLPELYYERPGAIDSRLARDDD